MSNELDSLRWRWNLTRDIPYLVPALIAGSVVYLTYLLTHPMPAYGAGLYLVMAEQIAQNDYLLPRSVSGYTVGGFPFSYPPFMLYVIALLLDFAGISGTELARSLPGFVVTITVVPCYYLSREILESRIEAGIAAFLIAVSPPVLHWHISAGGLVRAPAFLFMTAGIYFGLRLFDGERAFLLPATVSFALTVLTHPVYTAVFGLSYLWIYAYHDRTLRGLVRGATVAGGGLLIAAPWLSLVVRRHGFETFAGASGTHGGFGGRVADLLAGRGVESILFSARVETLFDSSPLGLLVMTLWLGLLLFVVGYTLVERDGFLVGWMVVVGVIIWKARFAFLIGSIALAPFLVDAANGLARRAYGLASRVDVPRRTLTRAIVAFCCITAASVGVAYATSSLQTRPDSETLQPYADESDVDAMRWAERNTGPSAEFVVVGDAAEWFPYYAERPLLVGHWGLEWEASDTFHRHFGMETRLSNCPTADCITSTLDENDLAPDYLYVPIDEYVHHGINRDPPPNRFQSLLASNRYELAYRNDEVAVFAVDRSTSTSAVSLSSAPTEWNSSSHIVLEPSGRLSSSRYSPDYPCKRVPTVVRPLQYSSRSL